MSSQPNFTVKLFYSYSHKDMKHREKIEKALTLLRDQDRILEDWSDQQILPGQNISEKIRAQIQETDIFVFLLSQDFIASKECRKEWFQASEITSERPFIVRVPIILSDCPWKDMEGMSQIKALPTDGRPIRNFQNEEKAWQQVYEGLKLLIERLRETFTIKAEFRMKMEETEFLSQEHVSLQSIFVFPSLSLYAATGGEENSEKTIEDTQQLLRNKYTLIHGEELSGKTALCRHLFLSLVDDAKPVLYVDLDTIGPRARLDVFRDEYQRQFHGDYTLWEKQSGKVIFLDNLSSAPHAIEHVLLAVKHFEQVIVTLSSDTFHAYFRDDERLAQFCNVEILPLTHHRQEMLIRKRLSLSGHDIPISDGQVDEIENQVNAVIISNRILPRYPFYVLSILQTYEGFMPRDLFITSYGHCYHVLIIAHLRKSGIPNSDAEINPCMNFLENLAFKIYRSGSGEHCIDSDSFEKFVEEYQKDYIIKDSTLHRLCDQDYGIFTRIGQIENSHMYHFKSSYMYYFILGKFLARNAEKHKGIIERMLDRSYITSNCLTLIFTIHHTSDDEIIEDILIRTMCALDDVEPSVLDRQEAKIFEKIVGSIPPQILSSDTVETERQRERNKRDKRDFEDRSELDSKYDEESFHAVNDAYRIMKNSEILGQILKNKYGSLKRERVVEIIETIADGGLRLVRLILGRPEEMNDIALFIHEKNQSHDLDEIKRVLRIFSFIWTMNNVEKIVGALNKPEIRSLIEEVVAKKNTPAYELIEFFLRLDTIKEFSDDDRKKLKSLWNDHRYPFFQKVISIRTQRYLNTHRVPTQVEQAVCSLLNIKYRARIKKLS